MKKVLITGANGFIGQVLVKQLLAAGIEVKALVREKAIHADIESIALDLTESWTSNPCEGVDTVFHLAGKAHALSEIAADDEEYQRINTEGTRKLLEAAKQAGVKRFIFFSSVKAVGDMPTMQDESNQTQPDTSYGQSKRAAEQLVLTGGYVPHPVVIRPCMVYGLSDKGNLPRMISAIERGFFPPLPEVHNHRSMVHVEDLATAALLVAQNPKAAGQIYIVSDGQANSTRQIYEWICFALNKKPLPFSIPIFILKMLAKMGDLIGKLREKRFMFDSDALDKLIGSAWYCSAKIENELGFKPKYDLQIALPEIVHYLKNKGGQALPDMASKACTPKL
jgi:nucleoside-diphosphate-sugar epimerase